MPIATTCVSTTLSQANGICVYHIFLFELPGIDGVQLEKLKTQPLQARKHVYPIHDLFDIRHRNVDQRKLLFEVKMSAQFDASH
eukprot:6184836-Pleurochrysis_carterae.AAC.5